MQRWFRFVERGDPQQQIRVGCAALDDDSLEVHEGSSILAPGASAGRRIGLSDVRLLPPVMPSTFVALWNNFHELAAKIGQPAPTEPLYFLKSPGSLAGPDDAIRKPLSYDGKVVYEGELGVVIGRRVHQVDETEAQAAILGYTCVNDVTAVDLLQKDPSFPQWTRAKGCDTFGPIGPCVATGLQWSVGRVRTLLGGRERQNYALSDMIFPPARIISLISREMTLLPGDVIACGTSLGVLPMRPGTQVEVVIDGIGVLRNVFEPQAPAELTGADADRSQRRDVT